MRISTLAGILPLAITLIAGAETGEREVRVLVVPPNPSNRPCRRFTRKTFTQTWPGNPSPFCGSTEEVASQTPGVIVLDFANTSLANWPCLAAEIEPFVNRIDQSKLQVFVTDPRYNVFYTTDFGNPILPMTLFSAPRSGTWSGQCEGKKRATFR